MPAILTMILSLLGGTAGDIGIRALLKRLTGKAVAEVPQLAKLGASKFGQSRIGGVARQIPEFVGGGLGFMGGMTATDLALNRMLARDPATDEIPVEMMPLPQMPYRADEMQQLQQLAARQDAQQMLDALGIDLQDLQSGYGGIV